MAVKTRSSVVPKPLTAKQFERLSPEKKRVLVAADALAMLAGSQPPSLKQGAYFQCRVRMPDVEQMHDALAAPRVLRNCTVCAKGALFLGHVRLFNQVALPIDLDNLDWDSAVCQPLDSYFDKSTQFIEYIFENGTGGDADDYPLAKAWITLIPRRLTDLRKSAATSSGTKGAFISAICLSRSTCPRKPECC